MSCYLSFLEKQQFLVPAPKSPGKDFGGLSSPRFLSRRGRNGSDASIKIPWCMCVCLVTQLVWLFVAPWTVACQTSLTMGILARILDWVAMPSSRGSSQSRDRTQVSHIAGGFFTIWATREAQVSLVVLAKFQGAEPWDITGGWWKKRR